MKYVSELKELENKKFDSVEELEKAEAEVKTALVKKEEAAVARKQEAAVVETAFKARNEARRAYNAKALELRKAYNEAIKKARDEFEAGLEGSTKELKAKEEAYDAALDEFIKKHPEGYHLSLKDGDNVTTISGNETEFRSLFDETDKFWDRFFDLLRF